MPLARALAALPLPAPATAPAWPQDRSAQLWRSAAYALGLLLAFALSVMIFRTPLQVSDNIENIWIVHSRSWSELIVFVMGYEQVRPMLWVTIKLVYELAQGNVFLTFKLYHSLQVFLVLILFCRVLEVRSFGHFLAAAVAMVVLVGLHTFAEPVTQAYPVNSLLNLILYCLISFNLVKSKGGWLVDVAAVLVFFVALFTLETGALVALILVAGYLLGYRGVSPRALWALIPVVALYIAAAFHIIDGIALGSRGVGFGLTVKGRDEVDEILGGHRLLLYAHNIVVAGLSVLFSEPRGGVWGVTNRVLHGGLQPWMLIQVTSSVFLTGVIFGVVLTRLRRWLRLDLTESDRLLVMFLLVLAGNAAICFPYSYDAVLGPAGAFYAIAAFAALGILFDPEGRSARRPAVLVILAPFLLAITLGWSARTMGLHYQMRAMAWKAQQEWPTAFEHLRTGTLDLHDQEFRQFILDVRRHALDMPLGHSFFWSRNVFRGHGVSGYFEE